MKYNKGFTQVGIIIALVAALIVGGGIVYLVTRTPTPSSQNTQDYNYNPAVNQDNTPNNLPTTTSTASLTSFSGSNGVFFAQSYGLTKVDIYYFPTGTEITNPSSLGQMTLLSTDTNGLQKWSLPAYEKKLDGSLSTDYMLVTSIYATGFIGNTRQNTINYPYTGASSIADHLYASTTPTISTTLPTPYISAQSGWPPVIQNSGTAYSCIWGSYKPISIRETTINGKKYCVKTEGDGAAGSIYNTYTYTTASGSGTKTTNFTLRYQSCGAYPDSAVAQCENAQSSFNLDAIVDSLMH